MKNVNLNFITVNATNFSPKSSSIAFRHLLAVKFYDDLIQLVREKDALLVWVFLGVPSVANPLTYLLLPIEYLLNEDVIVLPALVVMRNIKYWAFKLDLMSSVA